MGHQNRNVTYAVIDHIMKATWPATKRQTQKYQRSEKWTQQAICLDKRKPRTKPGTFNDTPTEGIEPEIFHLTLMKGEWTECMSVTRLSAHLPQNAEAKCANIVEPHTLKRQ